MWNLPYEFKRRFYGFKHELRQNRWYRRRIIAYWMAAIMISFDLIRYLTGWSKTSLVAGGILAVICFSSYENNFIFLNYGPRAQLMKDVGLRRYEFYIAIPLITMGIGAFIKLIWSRFSDCSIWISLPTFLGLAESVRLWSIIKHAVERSADTYYKVQIDKKIDELKSQHDSAPKHN